MKRTPSDPEEKEGRTRQIALGRWYKSKGRDLPWRKTRDPYKIWVSEIMLQQTQVETVIPYYIKFMARFPTIKALAETSLDKVLHLWQGLGYYARARNLHRGAAFLVKENKGRIPDSEKELMQVPGIGRSTAGAILSLAFEKSAPILDGNVKRVICRLFAVKDDPGKSKVKEKLWALSRSMTPEKNVHDYTQAIMDLGAMICKPKEPDCPSCPLKAGCLAYRKGEEHRIPLRVSSKPIPHRQSALGIIRRRRRILIVRRPEQGLLGGLWGFPAYLREGRKSFPETLKRGAQRDFGLEVGTEKKLGKVQHVYSHFKITMHLFECHTPSRTGKGDKKILCKWVFPSQFKNYPFSGVDQKVIKLLSGVS